MEQFEQFRQVVEAIIEAHAAEADKVKQAYLIYTGIQQTIEDVQAYLRLHPFPDKQQEIDFYKHEAPWLYGKSLQYLKISKLEVEKRKPSREALLTYIGNELNTMNSFYQLHEELLTYMLTNDSSRDWLLFTRHPKGNAPLNELVLIASDTITPASINCAWLLMYEEYGRLLKMERALAEGISMAAPVLLDGKKIEFDAPQAAAGEVIEGLYLKKVIKVDGRDAEINEIAEIWKVIFNKPLDNIYRIILINNRRKKEKTPFMNSMIDAITHKNSVGKK